MRSGVGHSVFGVRCSAFGVRSDRSDRSDPSDGCEARENRTPSFVSEASMGCSACTFRIPPCVTLIALLAAAPVARAAPEQLAPAITDPKDATVLIRVASSLRRGRGSGFVVGDGGWVVTAAHVVA